MDHLSEAHEYHTPQTALTTIDGRGVNVHFIGTACLVVYNVINRHAIIFQYFNISTFHAVIF